MLELSAEEQAMASGQRGPVYEFAMELIIGAARISGATRLQAIEAAYVGTTLATIGTHTDLIEWVAGGRGKSGGADVYQCRYSRFG